MRPHPEPLAPLGLASCGPGEPSAAPPHSSYTSSGTWMSRRWQVCDTSGRSGGLLRGDTSSYNGSPSSSGGSTSSCGGSSSCSGKGGLTRRNRDARWQMVDGGRVVVRATTFRAVLAGARSRPSFVNKLRASAAVSRPPHALFLS